MHHQALRCFASPAEVYAT